MSTPLIGYVILQELFRVSQFFSNFLEIVMSLNSFHYLNLKVENSIIQL